MVLMIQKEAVQRTVKWEIKGGRVREGRRKETSRKRGKAEESKQDCKGNDMLRG